MFMSTDVGQWLDYRHYYNKPPMKTIFDYAVVTSELLDEFDEFRAKLPGGEYHFQHSSLITFWSKTEQHPILRVETYGKEYQGIIGHNATDALAIWMKKARVAYTLNGTDIFR